MVSTKTLLLKHYYRRQGFLDVVSGAAGLGVENPQLFCPFPDVSKNFTILFLFFSNLSFVILFLFVGLLRDSQNQPPGELGWAIGDVSQHAWRLQNVRELSTRHRGMVGSRFGTAHPQPNHCDVSPTWLVGGKAENRSLCLSLSGKMQAGSGPKLAHRDLKKMVVVMVGLSFEEVVESECWASQCASLGSNHTNQKNQKESEQIGVFPKQGSRIGRKRDKLE